MPEAIDSIESMYNSFSSTAEADQWLDRHDRDSLCGQYAPDYNPATGEWSERTILNEFADYHDLPFGSDEMWLLAEAFNKLHDSHDCSLYEPRKVYRGRDGLNSVLVRAEVVAPPESVTSITSSWTPQDAQRVLSRHYDRRLL